MGGVDDQVPPVVLGEGPLVTILPCLDSLGLYPIPCLRVQAVRVSNRESSLDAKDASHPGSLAIEPGQGLWAPVRVGALDVGRGGEVHVSEIPVAVGGSLVALDGLGRFLGSPGCPGGGAGRARGTVAAVPDRAGMVGGLVRALDQEADLATDRIRLTISWCEFYRRWNVEWLYIRIPRLSQGPVQVPELKGRGGGCGWPRRGSPCAAALYCALWTERAGCPLPPKEGRPWALVRSNDRTGLWLAVALLEELGEGKLPLTPSATFVN